MLKSRLLHIITLLTALFVAVGCGVADSDEGVTAPSEGKYGTLHIGDEQIPINFVRVTNNEEWLMIVISPLTNASSLTTNAIIGLKKPLVGSNVDVEYKYCNADYVLVYEDPARYYAEYRRLQSGEMFMNISNNKVSVQVDVVLYDGTPFRYSNNNITIQ